MMSCNLPVLLLFFLIGPSTSKEIDTALDGSILLRRGGNKNNNNVDEIKSSLVSMDEMAIRFRKEMQGRRLAAACDVEQLKWLGQADVDYDDSPIILKSSDGSSVTIEVQNSFGDDAGVIDMYVGTQDGSGGEICHPRLKVDPGDVVADTIKARCMEFEPFALVTLQLDGDDLPQKVQPGDVVPTACCSERGGFYSYPKRSYTFAVPCFPGCPDNPITPAPSPKPTEEKDDKGGDTPAPVGPDECTCPRVKVIPSKCEVDILIRLMDQVIQIHRELPAQWLRASYHDAGTFNKLEVPPEGGAKGCLMNDEASLEMPQNTGLASPMHTLKAIKIAWENHEETCIDISSADIIQFAGFLAVTRQRGEPGFENQSMPGTSLTKYEKLKTEFKWGRPDETDCDKDEAENLPSFRSDLSGQGVPLRCLGVSREIKKKMIDQNGLTVNQTVALLGAHTIGKIRNAFPIDGMAWVPKGDDTATANGPVFNNDYFIFLIQFITHSGNMDQFVVDRSPFSNDPGHNFPDWMWTAHDSNTQRFDWLDSDICLAFPPINEAAAAEHPNYRLPTIDLAASEAYFLEKFDEAYLVQSMLGVDVTPLLPVECDSSCSHEGEIDDIVGDLYELLTEIDEEGNSILKDQLVEVAQCSAFDMQPGEHEQGEVDGLTCVGS